MPGTRPRKTTQRLAVGSGLSNIVGANEDSVEGEVVGMSMRVNEDSVEGEDGGGCEDGGDCEDGGVARTEGWVARTEGEVAKGLV